VPASSPSKPSWPFYSIRTTSLFSSGKKSLLAIVGEKGVLVKLVEQQLDWRRMAPKILSWCRTHVEKPLFNAAAIAIMPPASIIGGRP
jgi:hypothetical protein